MLAVVRRTHQQTNTQGRLQYTAQLNAQCNNNQISIALGRNFLGAGGRSVWVHAIHGPMVLGVQLREPGNLWVLVGQIVCRSHVELIGLLHFLSRQLINIEL